MCCDYDEKDNDSDEDRQKEAVRLLMIAGSLIVLPQFDDPDTLRHEKRLQKKKQGQERHTIAAHPQRASWRMNLNKNASESDSCIAAAWRAHHAEAASDFVTVRSRKAWSSTGWQL